MIAVKNPNYTRGPGNGHPETSYTLRFARSKIPFVRDAGSIIAGIAVGIAWWLLWGTALRALGIPPFQRNAQDRASRRERIKQLGKFRYMLLFGVLGFGLAFGLGITAADFVWRDTFKWGYELPKLAFMSIAFGLFQGVRNWSKTFRDPVPFPPNYPPQN
jgi:hypothetical protein